MGRVLKRVPLDFDWPLDKIWPGYMISFESLLEQYFPEMSYEERHGLELHFGRLLKFPTVNYGYGNEYVNYTCLEPPEGEGYQLWETTTEGSPQSPVFASLDELCAWCAEHATTFGSYGATAEQWKQMLEENFVHHQEGNAIFL
jgi:hypothetical protein